mmetsp:Transcript_838/g.3482  ORF Transcript_838/g.3482 Transcript_838/m.3482 type:complete len:158 (-) Transcript_838:1623-2096(-)
MPSTRYLTDRTLRLSSRSTDEHQGTNFAARHSAARGLLGGLNRWGTHVLDLRNEGFLVEFIYFVKDGQDTFLWKLVETEVNLAIVEEVGDVAASRDFLRTNRHRRPPRSLNGSRSSLAFRSWSITRACKRTNEGAASSPPPTPCILRSGRQSTCLGA